MYAPKRVYVAVGSLCGCALMIEAGISQREYLPESLSIVIEMKHEVPGFYYTNFHNLLPSFIISINWEMRGVCDGRNISIITFFGKYSESLYFCETFF